MTQEDLKSPLLNPQNQNIGDPSNPHDTANSPIHPRPTQSLAQSSLVINEEEIPDQSLQSGHDGPSGEPSNQVKKATNGNVETWQNKSLTFFPLVALLYSNVSGGPFGIETTLRSGGTFFTIIGILVATIIWSIPEALMTAELGTVYPDPVGSTAWVEDAFGERLAILTGYLNWVSGVADNTLYPGIFLDNCVRLFSSNKNNKFLKKGGPRFAIVSFISTVWTAINCLDLNTVGMLNTVTNIIALLPFVVIFFIGLPKINPKRWLQMPDTNETYKDLFPDSSSPGPLPLIKMGGILLRPYVNNLFWETTAYDSGASYSSEVKDLKNDYPKANIHTIWIVALSYLFPVMICTGVKDSNQKDYVDGYFTVVAKYIGGTALGSFMVFGAALSQIGIFQGDMSSDSLLLMGMAQHGYAPKIFAHRNKRLGTPVNAILLSYIVIIALGSLSIDRIMNMQNFCLCMKLIFEYASYLKLRYQNDHSKYPYDRVNMMIIIHYALKSSMI